MTEPAIETLLRREARLGASFATCASFFVCNGVVNFTFIGRSLPGAWLAVVVLSTLAGLLASYAWFATEVTLAASALGRKPVPYLIWMLAAPGLALLPLPVISIAIAASPLSLKFRLAGQLREEIHERTFRDAQ